MTDRDRHAWARFARATRQLGGQINNPSAPFTGIVPVIKPSIPFILTPNYTMNNNGAFTFPSLPAQLPRIIPNAYCYFAGGIISGQGNPAAWYFTQFSSTTAGTVFQNTYASGVPQIPASPTPFVGTGVGLQAPGPSLITAHSYPVAIPLTSSGWLAMEMLTSCNNTINTGTVEFEVTIAGTLVMHFMYNAQNQFGALTRGSVFNDGAVNRQILFFGPTATIPSPAVATAGFGVNADSVLSTAAINFAAPALTVNTIINQGTQADVAILEKFSMVAFT